MKTNWQIKKLGEICEITTGSSNTVDAVSNGQYAFFDRSKTIKRSDNFLFDGEALIIPGEGAEFFPKYYFGKFNLHQRAYALLNFHKEVDIKFVEYYLIFEHKYFERVAVGATVKSLRRRHFDDLEIPLPSIPEQKRIVKILDEAFEKLEKAKQNTEKNLSNSKELFESYLQNIFNNHNNNWEEKYLEELGQITSSKRIYKKEYVKTGVPFYRIKEIKELAHNKNITIELFISKARYIEIKNVFGIPQEGDILMTAVGTIGEIYVVKKDEEFYFKDGNILWFKDFNTVDPNFLKYALMSFVEQINKLSKGSAYSALTIEKIEKHRLCIPKSIAEQKTIVKKLDQLSEQTKKLESIYRSKLSVIEELKKSILSRAFTGNL